MHEQPVIHDCRSVSVRHDAAKLSDDYVRFLGVAELGALDLDVRIAPSCLIPDFGPYVLAFSIAIRPDEQSFGILGLLLDILGNAELVLLTTSALWTGRHGSSRGLTASTDSTTGASKSALGGHDVQPRY